MNIRGIAINADAGLLDGKIDMLRQVLDYYSELGFSQVEIAPHGIGAVYCGHMDKVRLREVQKILSRYSFTYIVHGINALNLMLNDMINYQGFTASMEFAAAIGARIMVYHAGRYMSEENFLNRNRSRPTQSEKKLMWQRECTALQSMGDIAKKYDVVIAVENARPYLDAPNYCYAELLEDLARMIKNVNHGYVGITLDTGHAYLAACQYGYDLMAGVKAIAPYVRHIHLHDNFGRCCASWEKKQHELAAMGRGDMHMPIGMGIIPADGILACLQQYDGSITLEMRPRYKEYYAIALKNAQMLIS
ncbi:sugar phosphate isomerase/epimerase family protein [Pectinatus haikarae]|uniref:Sugar phosphate isomerase/epimerase n=1 Tax=Pectinatus haikarae TaxID=349096 RepID=A0ABT9YAX5_9FIRM|nr:sugar phosphate isomerase/epimerase [Pectinatus haikarae]MDQ0204645.1 sugar phosphate isomerase/epimerase [Pectinatus haikarae]